MAVLDALADREVRSSPFLANLPSMRIDVNSLGTDTAEDKKNSELQMARITNFLGLEVLRFLHAERQLHLLQQQRLVDANAILLPRQPEPNDLALLLGDKVPSRLFVHPDPVLSIEEAEQYVPYKASFTTPISVWSKRLDGLHLGISVSLGDANEERALGLSSLLHVQDATRIVARQALAAGATLVYGGALDMKAGTPGQLTEVLFDMVGAYKKTGLAAAPLLNYAAWPWTEEVDLDWLAARLEILDVVRLEKPADLVDPDPEPGPGKFLRLARTPRGGYVLARSLSAMRRELAAQTKARVILGGKPHSFMGIMPGIVEEALLTIRLHKPLYVMGGFGGAAGLVAKAILGDHPNALTLEYQTGKSPAYAEVIKLYDSERTSHPELGLPEINYAAIASEFADYGLAGLSAANGLPETENREMLATGSIDSALFLLMKGLSTIMPQAG
jgi:hypothetical protein